MVKKENIKRLYQSFQYYNSKLCKPNHLLITKYKRHSEENGLVCKTIIVLRCLIYKHVVIFLNRFDMGQLNYVRI